MRTTEEQTLEQGVAQSVQEFWESYAGVRPERVNVIADQRVIAVWLEQVLAPAAQQMTNTPTGRLTLQKFGEHILDQARPQLQQLVAEATGQEVNLAEIHFDILTGSILGFFRRR